MNYCRKIANKMHYTEVENKMKRRAANCKSFSVLHDKLAHGMFLKGSRFATKIADHKLKDFKVIKTTEV